MKQFAEALKRLFKDEPYVGITYIPPEKFPEERKKWDPMYDLVAVALEMAETHGGKATEVLTIDASRGYWQIAMTALTNGYCVVGPHRESIEKGKFYKDKLEATRETVRLILENKWVTPEHLYSFARTDKEFWKIVEPLVVGIEKR